jgi:integron integrase
MERVHEVMRVRRYSRRTEETYVQWIVRIERFCAADGVWRHPDEVGAPEVEAFLTHLAVRRRVSAATQNQALNAIVFLYRHVLDRDLGDLQAVRARRPKRLPVVMSREEVATLIDSLQPPYRLMVQLMYGSGLRLNECCRLRVKDVDLDRGQLVVREAKGGKDRVVMLPQAVRAALGEHLERRAAVHRRDLARGLDWVELPAALHRKDPSAETSLGWQFVFASRRPGLHRDTGRRTRHPVHETAVQRAVKTATRLETTMIYTHVAETGVAGVPSPLDALPGP